MEEFDPVFFCLVLPCMMLCALAPIAAILGYAIWQSRRRRADQENLQNRLGSLAPDEQIFAVKYASQARFKQILKIFPWNEWGVFRLGPAGGIFYRLGPAGDNSDRPVQELPFPAATTSVQPVKRDFLRNSALSWVVLENEGSTHYFTVETGATIFGSRQKAEQMRTAFSQHFREA